MPKEQMSFGDTVDPGIKALPPSKKPKKQTPIWVEPDIPQGAVGGILADRTTVLEAEQYSSWHALKSDPILKHMWSPRFGKVKAWFNATLQSKVGSTIVCMPEHLLYEMTYGDWIVVPDPLIDGTFTLGKNAIITKVPRVMHHMKIDAHFLGPHVDIVGEGKVAIGVDDKGRRLIIRGKAYQKYFGTVRKRGRTFTVVPLDALKDIGGTFYSVLEVEPPPPPPTDDDLKTAFRKRSKETHPDLHPDDEGAGAKFQEVKAAYEVLKDPKMRDMYDMALQMATQSFGVAELTQLHISEGKHKEEWYPPITSGMLTCGGTQMGNNILIDTIDNIELVKKKGATRVAGYVNGMASMHWTMDTI
jgi:hypothetical protein